MPVSSAYRPDPRFPALGPDFYDPVEAARFPDLRLRYRNQRAAATVGLDSLTPQEWETHFGRFEPLPGNIERPLAMRYHGHQFRVYNPDIGDGRGFLFAQMRDGLGRLLDLGTKGSGRTPYSRFGDGRLTLKGAVREILATEMLEAQGVYTSKSFSVFETGESLVRNDEPSPTRAAVLVRLSHSHIRYGTFQRLAFLERTDLIEQLVTHTAELYHPQVLAHEGAADRATALLEAVVEAGATLAASWMAAGFVHGVLNTDNMNVTGESFDYGPWRFLPASLPGFTAAYFDQTGLYAFGRQPEAVSWNLAQLGACFLGLADESALVAALQRYPSFYQRALRERTFARLGLAHGASLESDIGFLSTLYQWMSETEISWEQMFHDWFAGEASADRAAQSPAAPLYEDQAFAPVRAGLGARTPVRPERLAHEVFQKPTPPSLVIDAVESLWAPIAERDDWSAFEAKLAEIGALREALDLTPSPLVAPSGGASGV